MKKDPNQAAKALLDKVTIPDDIMALARQQMARAGGLKGGKARAKALTPGRRKEIASLAAKARYAKASKSSKSHT